MYKVNRAVVVFIIEIVQGHKFEEYFALVTCNEDASIHIAQEFCEIFNLFIFEGKK